MGTGMIRQRASGESVIVVLEGIKAERDKGTAPLRWACGNIKNTDEILVLTILNPTVGSTKDYSCLRCPPKSPVEAEANPRFLLQQISQRREMYRRILRPFYDRCKSNGVKFEVKVAAGFRPKTIVIEEANNAEATWIVMDRSLMDDESLRYHKEYRNLAIVKEDDDVEVHHVSLVTVQLVPDHVNKETNPGSVPEDGPHVPNSPDRQSPPLGRTHERNSMVIDSAPGTSNVHENPLGRWTVRLKVTVELGWEEILAMTDGLKAWHCVRGEFDLYKGFLCDQSGVNVMVKRFDGDTDGVIVEAEKRVAWLMSHRNILAPMAYHESSDGSALVYQYKGNETLQTLDQYLNPDTEGRPAGLTCPERMKVAIGTARGIRYMHEECPGGPVVHGDVQPWNVYLGPDHQPLISGFGRTRWLKLEQMAMDDTCYRCWHETPLDLELMALVKSDVFAFGVLLLRLFCQRPMPEGDDQLVQWARPLLLQGAFHELLDQEIEELDMFEMYRVVSVATQCTRTRPLSRPTMTQVLSFLRGESSCAVQSSPASDCSLGRETNQFF